MPNIAAEILKQIVSWRVILDILLIGMAIFLIYQTLRRLGTWKILTGVLIAIILFGAAKMLDLSGIIWIYSNLSHVVVIALIVIFQPELRKMLERAASIGGKKIGRGSEDLSYMISDAVHALAKQRRGAILVFPGKEPITQWLAGGFSLDGEPSFSLIMSIFDPNSPGHDGAMIIENGRLSSFGVRLPLSKTRTLSEEFGTRHHAAMGLSEVCDAMAVVVSEERGSVTTFYGGKIKRVQDKNDLSSKLMSHWKNTASKTFYAPKKGKKWAAVSQVSLSLALAFVFWFVVIFAQAEIHERVFSVPIEYIATPQHIALVGEKPTEVKLHLTGPKSDLNGVNISQMPVKIDLSKAEPGKQTFVITEAGLHLPKRVKLLDAEPSTLVLSFREIVEREFIVKPQLVGTLPEHLKIVSVDVNPQTVQVLSPSDEGEKKEISVMTTPIYLQSIEGTTRLFCKIIAPPAVQPVGKRWPDVEVLITVKYVRGKK